MSGWLLMGLPGVAYWFGLSDAVWTAIGLLIGTYLNWLFVAKRLRGYSYIAGDAITIPDFFSNRFKEEKKVSNDYCFPVYSGLFYGLRFQLLCDGGETVCFFIQCQLCLDDGFGALFVFFIRLSVASSRRVLPTLCRGL